MYPKIQQRQVLMNVLHPNCAQPINEIWRWTKCSPRRGRQRSHMAGIYSNCRTWEINKCSSWFWRTHRSCYTHTHTRLTALCPGLPGWAGTRKVKQILILPKQETVASAGPYASLHLAPDRYHTSTPPLSFFTGRMPFLPPNQQRQSTEGRSVTITGRIIRHG